MATIRPFSGLRFAESAGSLADITAPPYDVISPEQREELAAKSPYNAVRLTLPETEEGDRSKFVKYARSASRLEEWRRNGTLALDEKPSLYRYTQTFTVPGTDQVFERTKLVTLIKVEPYSNGVVLPHERTFPKHKEDRMRILEATRSHLECIFGLFEDDDKSCHAAICNAPAEKICDFVTDEDGIRHVFEKIDNQASLDAIVGKVADKKVWIADGHHRYETALAFREALGERDGIVPEDFMMMALCSISDPGLVLLPTHRILKTLNCSADELKQKMSADFSIEDCDNSKLMAKIGEVEKQGGRAFGVALPGGKGFTATVKDLGQLTQSVNIEGSDDLKKLDVSILHGYIFEKLLGLTGVDFFGYTRIEEEAVNAVENGSPASFLMNPPTVHDMRVIASGGDFMPQKSTYYYPKLLSGLVMWSLKDFN